MSRVPGCDESHGEADCVWRGTPCCQACLVNAARTNALQSNLAQRVTDPEVAAAHDAIAQSKAIRAAAPPKPKETRRRLVSTTVYLRPDQVVELAQLAVTTFQPTAEFIRLAIDSALRSVKKHGRLPSVGEPPPFRSKAIEPKGGT
jgi:hypothetical protein